MSNKQFTEDQDVELVKSNKVFGGLQQVYKHYSQATRCMMNFGLYLPPDCSDTNPAPVIYWLSGLTCNEENFIIKSGAQRYAAKNRIILVTPDTSPRGMAIKGEDDDYDFGTGASFYVDATIKPFDEHYQMHTYITKELPVYIQKHFPVIPDCQSIMGHSMGGHGALICYLKNPGLYRSVSAFAPICNPTKCPWGIKALKGYLGGSEEKIPQTWYDYDATALVTKYEGPPHEILIDQGNRDEFLKSGQLLPDNFIDACKNSEVPVIFNMRDGYDHSYYFIQTFIGEHIDHHTKFLNS